MKHCPFHPCVKIQVYGLDTWPFLGKIKNCPSFKKGSFVYRHSKKLIKCKIVSIFNNDLCLFILFLPAVKKKKTDFQSSNSSASENERFSVSNTPKFPEWTFSLLWFEWPHQRSYKRLWAFKPRQASKLLHPLYFQQVEPMGARLIFPKTLRAAHAVAGKQLLLPHPCTWNLRQHLWRKQGESRQGERGEMEGLLPRCFCKKMERTCLPAFTGRSFTIQRYILKNKRLSRRFHTKAPDTCVSAVGRRRVDIPSLTDVLNFLQNTKRGSVNTSQKPEKQNLQLDSIVHYLHNWVLGLLGFSHNRSWRKNNQVEHLKMWIHVFIALL